METTKEKYNVIFDGKIKQGENLAQVKYRMAALFKVEPAVIERIFSGAPTTLQRSREKEQVLKYKEAFEKTGALCRIVAENPVTPPIETAPAAPGTGEQWGGQQPGHPPGTGDQWGGQQAGRPAEAGQAQQTPYPPQHEQPGQPGQPGQMYTPPQHPQPGYPPTAGQTPPAPGQQEYEQPGQAGQLYTPPPPSQPELPAAPAGPRTRGIGKDAYKALGGGLVMAIIFLFIPFLAYVFHYIIILVHELGHTITGWLYGYPSLPAFDFMYGGGITAHENRTMIIVAVVYLLMAGLLFLFRRNPLSLVVLVIIIVVYSLIVFTSAHQVLILFMGHGTELVFAVVFLYRALSGSAIIVPAERPLYAFLGFFILFMDVRFAHRLMTSAVYRAEYRAAKGGGDWMDFSRLSEFFGVELTDMAAFFLFLCILVPIAAYLIFRYKEYIGVFVHRLREV